MPPASDSEAAAEAEREGTAGEGEERGLPLLEGEAVLSTTLADAEEVEE